MTVARKDVKVSHSPESPFRWDGGGTDTKQKVICIDLLSRLGQRSIEAINHDLAEHLAVYAYSISETLIPLPRRHRILGISYAPSVSQFGLVVVLFIEPIRELSPCIYVCVCFGRKKHTRCG